MKRKIAYTYSYSYKPFPTWSGFHPMIPIRLFADPKRSKRADAYLDTGAFYSIFDTELAEDMGITLPSKSQALAGIGTEQGYPYRLWIKFDPLTKPLECQVYFVRGWSRRPMPNLLGHMGVFNHLQIGFDEAHRKIYMALNA